MTIRSSVVTGGHATDGEIVDLQGGVNELLAAFVSSVLGVIAGGTGIGSYAVGDMLYASAASTLSKLADIAKGGILVSGGVTTAPKYLAAGTSGQILQSAGSGSDVAWAGEVAWTALSGLYVNSWVDFGGGQMAGGYMKDASGFVHLRGLIKSGTTATVATLPAGYRPSASVNYGIVSNSAFGNISVNSAGVISLGVFSNASVQLDGITFDTR